ncbi:DHA2 family efflux MFS transporter permease subunit [Gordonia liuliyuniae]|uniref:DHA2 family efflux MFS transporter permease subunit n=1 Tax=Gordonia liuliyuniae TaxID=2911517 RepID=A0ABS9IPH0_9ACTN|nr:DHA2 family efflux MFS transporter permease subunit [Gordonia liuliyuniae]MCF8587450.1 DHA2 family efflux MFS transporter permease subunit [Gordonia liuliyuniae]
MRTKWLALAALCFAELLVMVDNTIVNVALPTMSRDLNAGVSGLQWIVDAYTLVFAGLLLTGGYLGDRFEHRRMLLTGVVGFVVVSVGAALAGTLGELIAARAGLGLFAALVFPATLALIVGIFTDPKQRAAAVGVWAATSGIAIAIGPVLGGWLLEHFSWASVFWVNVPFGIAAFAAVAVVIPARGVGDGTPLPRIDAVGVVLSIVGLGLLTYSVIEGPSAGWGSVRTVGGLLVAVGVLVGFVVHQRRVAHPIFDVRLFANRRFAAAAGMVAVAFFALFGFIFLITQYFQAVQGYTPLQAGIRTLPFAIVVAALSPGAMAASHRFGPRPVAVTGALLMASGFGLVQLVDQQSTYFGLIIWSMMLMAAGLALISGPCTQVIMDALTPEQAGAGSAVNDTTREIGGTLGVAVLGSVLTSVYASDVADRLTSIGVPGPVKEIAEQSVMAGVEASARAPGGTGAAIHDVVASVFIDGLAQATWVAVGVSLVSAVVGGWALREPRRGTQVDGRLEAGVSVSLVHDGGMSK